MSILDDAPEGTIVVRHDGRAAQRLHDAWYEVGCADPFDAGCMRDWADAQPLTHPDDLRPTSDELGRLRDEMHQIAAWLVAMRTVGGDWLVNTAQVRAIESITAIVTTACGRDTDPWRATTLCPGCLGEGWTSRPVPTGGVLTRPCPTCHGGDSVHTARRVA